jgi:glycosyltransferase involved in cell wall biosynthesis
MTSRLPHGKIRLLCCIHDFRGRGAEKALLLLLRHLSREKYRIGVFVVHDTFTQEIPEDVELFSAHVPVYDPSAGLWTIAKANIRKLFSLRAALKRFRPDVVLSVAGTNILLVVARHLFYRNTRIILSEHTMPSSHIEDSRNRPVVFLTHKLLALTYPRADLIVTPAHAVSEELQSLYGVPDGKLRVLDNPLDFEHIRNAAREMPKVDIPRDSSFNIGFVGTFSREKNVSCLLKAFAKVRNNGISSRLYLVGDGPERTNLEAMAGELHLCDSVFFLGFQENPYAILSRFDVLVLPSLYEVFPYVLIEAIACGVPVISTRWKGCESFYRDMQNSILVPVDDHTGLAIAITKLIEEPQLGKRLVEQGKELIEKCNVNVVTEHYDAAIASVLERP